MNELVWYTYQKEFRKLSEAGGARTVSEAKESFLKEAHAFYVENEDFAVINAVDLKASGRWMMRQLVRRGFARPLFEEHWTEPCDSASWVVTRECWAAEEIRKGRSG